MLPPLIREGNDVGYTHFDKVSGINGIAVGAKGAEKVVADASGNLYQGGSKLVIKYGEVTLDGSNPTPVSTGLTNIVAACATIKSSVAADDPLKITVDYTGGTLNIYAWKPTAGTPDVFPLVASTNNTAVIPWIAIGT